MLLTNPADIKAGDDIKAEVLLNGKPVKAPIGLTYDGYSAEQDAYMAKAETGADGTASFSLKRGSYVAQVACTGYSAQSVQLSVTDSIRERVQLK